MVDDDDDSGQSEGVGDADRLVKTSVVNSGTSGRKFSPHIFGLQSIFYYVSPVFHTCVQAYRRSKKPLKCTVVSHYGLALPSEMLTLTQPFGN